VTRASPKIAIARWTGGKQAYTPTSESYPHAKIAYLATRIPDWKPIAGRCVRWCVRRGRVLHAGLMD